MKTGILVMWITVAAGLGLGAAALYWLGWLIYKHIYHCTKEVNARFYDVVEHKRSDGKSNYYPVFRYNFGGKYYEVEGQQKLAGGEEEAQSLKKDQMMRIYLNPQDPTMLLYGDQRNSKLQMTVLFIVATILVAAGICAVFFGIF